jgi:hypothetical protein
MGLDMSLKAEKHVSNSSLKTTPAEREAYKALLEVFGIDPIPNTSAMLSVTFAVWCKTNQIHRWFVENAQDGNDDNDWHYVSRDQLQDLVNKCKLVLDNKDKAGEILPRQAGFFFGSTTIDEFYYQELKDTVDQITPVLNNPKFEGWEFYYLATW